MIWRMTLRLGLVAMPLMCMTGVAVAAGDPLARDIERYETSKLQAVLDSLMGPGRAKAVVNVVVDRSRVETVEMEAGPTATARRAVSEWSGASGRGSSERVIRRVTRRVRRTVTTGPRVQLRRMVVMVDGRPIFRWVDADVLD